MTRLILPILIAGGLASACASHGPLIVSANSEHIAVTAVHAVVQAEKSAYEAGAYDGVTHQKYVAALLKVVQAEKALNDALTAWNGAQGQPMPAQVSAAVQALTQILVDVTPLIPQHSAVASLADSATVAIQALSGGK